MKSPVLVLLTLLQAGGTLQAQAPSHRRGLWFAAGFGLGQVRFSCDSCDAAGSGLASHYVFRTGLTLSPSILLGVELDKVTSQRNTNGISGIHLSAYLYPVRRGNLFLKAGLGKSFFDSNTPHSPDTEGSGISVLGGLGYDLRATERISATPMFMVLYGRQTVESAVVRETAYAFSIGLTFH